MTHANLLIDNLEERLEAARRVQNLIRQALPIQLPIMNKVANQNVENFRMELIHLSAFLFADMRHVRSVVRDPRHSTVFESVMTMEAFLGICKLNAPTPWINSTTLLYMLMIILAQSCRERATR